MARSPAPARRSLYLGEVIHCRGHHGTEHQIEGHREGDLESALEEVLKKVREGYRAGSDSNDTGRYHFTINGSPVEHYALALPGTPHEPLDERFERYDEAAEHAGGKTVVGLDENGDVITF